MRISALRVHASRRGRIRSLEIFVPKDYICIQESASPHRIAFQGAAIPNLEPMMDFRSVTGAITLAVLLVAAVLSGSSLIVFWNTPSAFLVLVGGMAAWWGMAGNNVPTLFRTLNADAPTPSALAAGLETLRAGRTAFWMVGLVCTLIGWIQMFQGLDDWNAFGPAMAVSLLTLLYAMLADLFVLSSMKTRLRIRRAALSEMTLRPTQLDQELHASREAMDALHRRARERSPQSY